jgi:hypothetical protein
LQIWSCLIVLHPFRVAGVDGSPLRSSDASDGNCSAIEKVGGHALKRSTAPRRSWVDLTIHGPKAGMRLIFRANMKSPNENVGKIYITAPALDRGRTLTAVCTERVGCRSGRKRSQMRQVTAIANCFPPRPDTRPLMSPKTLQFHALRNFAPRMSVFWTRSTA